MKYIKVRELVTKKLISKNAHGRNLPDKQNHSCFQLSSLTFKKSFSTVYLVIRAFILHDTKNNSKNHHIQYVAMEEKNE